MEDTYKRDLAVMLDLITQTANEHDRTAHDMLDDLMECRLKMEVEREEKII